MRSPYYEVRPISYRMVLLYGALFEASLLHKQKLLSRLAPAR